MATNFTNKYMQVFQNYNEFGEHSADYVRGEDHIAFLIEENEVIYWLYLEQVWRPLNVRTTTTGELEDGRTKVAVRLEYVKGGQKYTSVPNIPDPERITSMSRFLENYPDIEEVNVSGTVNLTDLSYAFAGSKIKDFSMLDTSNVDNITGFINNVYDETLNINFETNKHVDNSNIKNVLLNDLKITTNAKDVLEENFYNFDLYNVKCNNFEFIQDNANYTINISGCNIDTVKNENGIVRLHYSAQGGFNGYINNVFANKVYINCDSIATESIDINCDTCVLYDDSYTIYNFDYKAFITANNLIIGNNQNEQMNILFGNGLKYNNNINISIALKEGMHIPSFIFTTPIVDDAFYAKYAQYNTPISIFQYKTIFEEVADINISSELDSSLLYADWDSINFDTTNMNIEIHNIINFENNNKSITFNKFILDNRELYLTYDTYPKDCSKIDNIFANEGYISGNYVCYLNWTNFGSADRDTELSINTNTLLKNIILWDYSEIHVYGSILTDNNIKFAYSKAPSMPTINCNTNNVDISNLRDENNIVTCALVSKNENYKLLYKDDITLNIITGYNKFYLILIVDYVKEENNHTINNSINIMNWNNYLINFEQVTKIENVYLHGNINLSGFYSLTNNRGDFEDYGVSFKVSVGNIYGENITINLPGLIGLNASEILNIYPDPDVYKHIDIYSSKASNNSYITIFQNLDNESTINLVAKLIDNTSSSNTKTIYMYRSQANIIGEENIAAAVAKNYEFAIIEN